jgi:glycine cleavage system aminomethyltransferase T
MMWGGELVLRNGVAVGQITSAAWGETLGACVALAYIWCRDGAAVTTEYLDSGRYEVNVGGTVCLATMHRRAPYDPDGLRIKR